MAPAISAPGAGRRDVPCSRHRWTLPNGRRQGPSLPRPRRQGLSRDAQQQSLRHASRWPTGLPWSTSAGGESPPGPGPAVWRGLPGDPPRLSPEHRSGSFGISSRPETPGSPSSSAVETCPATDACPAAPLTAAGPVPLSLWGTRTPPARDHLPLPGRPHRAPPWRAAGAPPCPPETGQPSPPCRRSWSCCGPRAGSQGAEPAPSTMGQGWRHPGDTRHGVPPALRRAEPSAPAPAWGAGSARSPWGAFGAHRRTNSSGTAPSPARSPTSTTSQSKSRHTILFFEVFPKLGYFSTLRDTPGVAAAARRSGGRSRARGWDAARSSISKIRQPLPDGRVPTPNPRSSAKAPPGTTGAAAPRPQSRVSLSQRMLFWSLCCAAHLFNRGRCRILRLSISARYRSQPRSAGGFGPGGPGSAKQAPQPPSPLTSHPGAVWEGVGTEGTVPAAVPLRGRAGPWGDGAGQWGAGRGRGTPGSRCTPTSWPRAVSPFPHPHLAEPGIGRVQPTVPASPCPGSRKPQLSPRAPLRGGEESGAAAQDRAAGLTALGGEIPRFQGDTLLWGRAGRAAGRSPGFWHPALANRPATERLGQARPWQRGSPGTCTGRAAFPARGDGLLQPHACHAARACNARRG